jgi:hypothetical protein
MTRSNRVPINYRGDIEHIYVDLKNISPVTGSFNIRFLPQEQWRTSNCFGGTIAVPNRFVLSIQIDAAVGDMEIKLSYNPARPPVAFKVFRYKLENLLEQNNLFLTVIEQNLIFSVCLNGEVLEDVTPYLSSRDVAGSSSPNKLIILQKNILESMFGKEWFLTANKMTMRHPAYYRWKLCNELSNTALTPGHLSQIPEFAHMLLDNSVILECSYGDIDKNIFGDLATYGSPRVIQRIRTEIVDADKYRDIMLELAYAAWHISYGHRVNPTDAEGTADLEIRIQNHNLPIFAECKRIKRETNDNRFRKVIDTANRQIKNSADGNDCYGLLIIDISDRIAETSTSSGNNKEINNTKHLIESLLKNHYTSISAVLLMWDEFTISNPIPNVNPVFLVRRSLPIMHPNASSPIPKSSIIFKYGNTVSFKIYWQPSNKGL